MVGQKFYRVICNRILCHCDMTLGVIFQSLRTFLNNNGLHPSYSSIFFAKRTVVCKQGTTCLVIRLFLLSFYFSYYSLIKMSWKGTVTTLLLYADRSVVNSSYSVINKGRLYTEVTELDRPNYVSQAKPADQHEGYLVHE